MNQLKRDICDLNAKVDEINRWQKKVEERQKSLTMSVDAIMWILAPAIENKSIIAMICGGYEVDDDPKSTPADQESPPPLHSTTQRNVATSIQRKDQSTTARGDSEAPPSTSV